MTFPCPPGMDLALGIFSTHEQRKNHGGRLEIVLPSISFSTFRILKDLVSGDLYSRAHRRTRSACSEVWHRLCEFMS